MELSNQLPGSHPLTAPVHPPERVTGPPELHHSEGRYREVIHASVPVALIAVQMASASSGIEGRQAPAPLQWQ
jgi:hypothetical protein